jgi:nicotinate-nucleotide adenylyltransferase
MRLGIFGGSFDPVHNAHLAVARACQEQARLDEVWFTPTAIQPLKLRGPHATNSQRIEMLNLAIADEQSKLDQSSDPGRGHRSPRELVGPRNSWRVCTLEIDRGGYSYTVDTLRQIHDELPDAELFFLLGADAVRDVPNWREPAEIFRLATPLVVRRAGQAEPDTAALAPLCPTNYQPMLVEMPAMEVSSSEIRRQVAAGEAIDDLVPAAVAAFIAKENLYR